MSTQSCQYWLMKSEPDVFSFGDLKAKKRTLWDGVRNYMARNYMMKNMRVGDMVLFYHSNAKPSGVAGLAEITGPARPDASAWDRSSPYFDEKSRPENPRWHCVEVGFKSELPRFVSLEEIKKHPQLQEMVLLNNSRLSVQPVSEKEFKTIYNMAEKSQK